MLEGAGGGIICLFQISKCSVWCDRFRTNLCYVRRSANDKDNDDNCNLDKGAADLNKQNAVWSETEIPDRWKGA